MPTDLDVQSKTPNNQADSLIPIPIKPDAQKHLDHNANNKQKSINKKEEKKKDWLDYILEFLYYFGASASALQGFFSIESFVASIAAIPGLGVVAAIPYLWIIFAASAIAYYALKVEQPIFKPHFEGLVKYLFNKGDYKSFDHETCEKINSICKLDKDIGDELNKDIIDELEPNNYKKEYKPSGYKPRIPNNINKSRKEWLKYKAKLYGARLTSVFTVFLRAIVSIATTMLGIKSFLLIMVLPFGITALPAIITPLCVVMSAVGYFLKTSQNIVDQYNYIHNLFGIKKFIKEDYKKANATNYKQLKQIYHLRKYNVLKRRDEHKENENKENLWQKTLRYALELGFYLGAIGLSTQGFFSIDKFISQMGTDGGIQLFNIIPSVAITILSCSIFLYTFFVENKTLHTHFDEIRKNIVKKLSFKKKQKDNTKYEHLYIKHIDSKDEFFSKIIKTCEIKSKKVLNNDTLYHTTITTTDPYETKIVRRYFKILDIINDSAFKSEYGKKNKIAHDIEKDLKIKIKTCCDKIKPTNKIHYIFAAIGSVAILLFRAVSSIGLSMLGLSMAFKVIGLNHIIDLGMMFVGLPPLGTPIVLGLCLIMASFGYFIKCAQNLELQFNKTMSKLFYAGPSLGLLHKGILDDLREIKHDVLEKYNAAHKEKYSECLTIQTPIASKSLLALYGQRRTLAKVSSLSRLCHTSSGTESPINSPVAHLSDDMPTPTIGLFRVTTCASGLSLDSASSSPKMGPG